MFNSIKVKLFSWYIVSLTIVIAYFLLFIHFFTFPYALHILIGLFIFLAAIQLVTIYKITKSITYLSSKIKAISSKNLQEKITGINQEDEIGELANSFNNLLDRLHEAFKREQQFIGDIAHELKTPLTTLRSSLEIALHKTRNSEEYKKVLENALLETDQLSRTLKNVLDLAWTQTPNSLNKQKFNLSELINDLFEIAQKMSVKKRIGVKLSSARNISFSGYKDKLARALLNLIDNAIKYSSIGGKVELILEKSPNNILISIIDNGPGISGQDLPNIFNRFYRGTKTDKVFGSGLGLAIAKSIISLHQGEIKVKSSKGKGSIFIVVLPRHQ